MPYNVPKIPQCPFFFGKKFVIFDFKRMGIRYLNALLTLFVFPKGNPDSTSIIANAEKQ